MNRSGQRRSGGFTILEVMVIIVTVALVLVVLLPMLQPPRMRSKRINCVNNLKQVGLAARMWSNDNGDRFPWAVSTNQGGTLEYAPSPDVFRHFAVMTTELASPKILACPADPDRLAARSFTVPLANSNVSYFVGLEADETRPQSILTGDRHIGGGITNGALLVFSSRDVPRWGAIIHTNQSNVGLGDGSVQQLTDSLVARQFQQAFATQTGMNTMRLAIPRIPEDLKIDAAPRWKLNVPVPLAGALLTGATLLALWLLIRRRVLANAGNRANDS
jgi:competence protein ComGC